MEVKPAPDLHSKPHKNPREYEFVSYKHICHYYAPGSHYFGYKVLRIPSRAYRITGYRHVYYCYNGIYYAPYGSYYVVCRPPFETVLEYELAKALDEIDRPYVTAGSMKRGTSAFYGANEASVDGREVVQHLHQNYSK